MRNIWEIFKRDALRIRTNVIAIIAIVGITVVPCLYAWFNIAASWDPYKNTGNLKVAVASVDEGYDGQLIPIEINVGDQVLSMMRGNTQNGSSPRKTRRSMVSDQAITMRLSSFLRTSVAI